MVAVSLLVRVLKVMAKHHISMSGIASYKMQYTRYMNMILCMPLMLVAMRALTRLTR